MPKINVNLYPKEGYRFKESDGTIIVGKTWAGVIARVAAYRKRAGLSAGNPEVEVNAQACRNNPGHCSEDSPVTSRARQEVSLKGRVLKWFNMMRGSREPLRYVDDGLAKARGEICLHCPKRVSLPEGCASCRSVLNELRHVVVPGRPVDTRLTHCGCLVAGFEPATAVHLDNPTESNPEYPPQCWFKRL